VVRLVGLVRDQQEAAPLRLGGDDPAVDELLVDGEIRSDDADHLRDIRGDQLFPERVRSIEEGRAREYFLDRAAAGTPRDKDLVTARQRRAAALQHALERLAARKTHRVVTPAAFHDEATRERRRVGLTGMALAVHAPPVMA